MIKTVSRVISESNSCYSLFQRSFSTGEISRASVSTTALQIRVSEMESAWLKVTQI